MSNFFKYFLIGMFASNFPWLGVGMLFGFPAYFTTAVLLSLKTKVYTLNVIWIGFCTTFIIYSLMNGFQIGYGITLFSIPCILSAAGLVMLFKNSLTNTDKIAMV